MNNKEFLSKVSKETWLSYDITKKTYDQIVATIYSELKEKEEVKLFWLWKFYISSRKARKWINPKTLEKIDIKASKTPSFKVTKKLKDLLK